MPKTKPEKILKVLHFFYLKVPEILNSGLPNASELSLAAYCFLKKIFFMAIFTIMQNKNS